MALPAKAAGRSGELLNGAYELHEVLESDADQETYRATDKRHGKVVQIKLLREELALQAGAVQRFLHAPKSLSGLRHPNLSQVLAIESDATGIPFVVQEHVQGEPLGRTVESFPQGMPLGVAINVLCPVVEAVAAAHERGLVHGRLHSKHVLLAGAGGSSVPKVTAFGRAPDGADARSDVWALGALLYQTLSGQSIERPGAAREPLEDHAPHLPAELIALVERCLSKDPDARPADAGAVRDALSATRERLRGAERKPAAKPAVDPRVDKPADKPAVARVDARVEKPAAKPAVDPRADKPATKPAAKPAVERVDQRVEKPAATPAAPRASKPEAKRTPVAAERAATEPIEPAVAPTVVQPAVAANALDATVVAPRAKAAADKVFDRVLALPSAGEVEALAATMAAGEKPDEEPQLSVEPPPFPPPAASAAPPAAAAPEVRTLSDLAAAFGPMEGSDRVGGGEHEQASAGRSFRKAFDEAQAATVAARRQGGSARKAAAREREEAAVQPAEDAQAPASRKQLREGLPNVPRALSEEQLRNLRVQAQDEESRRDRILGALVFLLFVLALAFFTPLLCDPKHQQAQALLGTHTKLAIAGFSVLSVIALIRVWTVQIHTRPVLLRPVTTTLKVVTTLVCVLSATFFLPAGALGPIERFARMALPWAGSFFYLFLAFYGLLRSARDAAGNAPAALAMGVLYCGAFFGSYRVLAVTVFANDAGGALLPGGAAQQSTAAKLTGFVLHGEGNKQDEGTQDEALQVDAGTAEPVHERKMAGASETDDMEAIDQLEQGRKQKSNQFEQLGGQVKEIAK